MRKTMVFTVLWVLLVPFSISADWPQFLGPNRDGVGPATNLSETWPEKGPRALWQVEVGKGFAGASIRDGKVYLLDRVDEAQDVFRCFDFANGQELWRYAYDIPGRLPFDGSRSAPTIEAKRAYAVGPFGHVYCFDLDSHKPLWIYDFLKEYGGSPPRWGFSQSPLLHENLVIVGPMNEGVNLLALDRDTGKQVWQTTGGEGDGYSSPILFELDGVPQILFLTTKQLVSVEPATGKVLWTYRGYQNPIPIPNPTLVSGNRLFLTGGYGAGSVLLQVKKSGSEWKIDDLFRLDKRGSQIHNALFVGDHLFANFNTNENLRGQNGEGYVCLDLKGETKWQSGSDPGINRGSLIAVGNKILALGGEDGVLRLFTASPTEFKLLASAPIFENLASRENNIWAPMAMVDGKLVLRNQDVMKCLDLKNP